jgi:flavin-dependent dehydrogenase
MYTALFIFFHDLDRPMGGKRKRIAVVGAGIAGLTCALELAGRHDVEVFEACKQCSESRPFQMEGALHYLDNIPPLEPTYPVKMLELTSEKERTSFHGNIGYLYKIGGLDGIDAVLREEVSQRVDMRHSQKIIDLDLLSDYDIIVAADGYRSKISLMAGMREEKARITGLGIGLTVKGDFEVGTTFSLFHNDYAPGGYLYLIPISNKKASLVSASIGNDINAGSIRQRMRQYAKQQGLTVIDEWTDIEKWYRFNCYHKDNVFVIGGAASFTDATYGFGLKYSIQSAHICAGAINSGGDYHVILKPLLNELAYWRRIGRTLVNTSNAEKDIFVRLAQKSIIKKRIEKGMSIRLFFRTLVNYFKLRHGLSVRSHLTVDPAPAGA